MNPEPAVTELRLVAGLQLTLFGELPGETAADE
jgi:hypothetical protein